jgi:alkane 1-monooxygenase
MKNPFSFTNALPFWLSLSLVPTVLIAANYGGWTLVLPPLMGWGVFTAMDFLAGLNTENQDPETPEASLKWYRAITLIWFPIQALVLFGLIYYVQHTTHLDTSEKIWLFFGVGILSGGIGINYSHELMHQRNRFERWLGDLLLATVMYGHFRSEHLLVHHRYVATPKDPDTARYNEGFYRFFPRILWQCYRSGFKAEVAMLARKSLPWWHLTNPFWKFWGLQIACVALAYVLGGVMGVGLFLFQAAIAIWQLELVNYIEHYGLTRKHLGDGKYEIVLPRHSWNASHKVSNWLLINLQRHSDHHYKPDRRFPLLQNYDTDEAPQLPFGYPLMTMAAMVPPIWRRFMNPKVRAWRAKYYPEITDWSAYKTATNPMPR